MMQIVERLLHLNMNDILDEEVVIHFNRARCVVTFSDGQFKEDETDDFLYYIMYDPIKGNVILINRMALHSGADITNTTLDGYVVSYNNGDELTWLPEVVYNLMNDSSEEATDCNCNNN